MSEKRFIVGETLMDYYQIKCEKEDYSRVLAPNTVADLLNEQQATINKLKEAIRIAYEEKPYPKIEDIMTIYSKLEKEISDE